MIGESSEWTSDVPVSLPTAPESSLRDMPNVSMGGFLFTVNGMCFDTTDSDIEQLFRSRFVPRSVKNAAR